MAVSLHDELSRRTADGWYELGCAMESLAPHGSVRAKRAYERALALDPELAEAHINLGRLLHEARCWDAAEVHYRAAVRIAPTKPICWFNLGVVLDDQGRLRDAVSAYQRALSLDGHMADAHHNLRGVRARLARPAQPAAPPAAPHLSHT